MNDPQIQPMTNTIPDPTMSDDIAELRAENERMRRALIVATHELEWFVGSSKTGQGVAIARRALARIAAIMEGKK